MGWPKGKPKPPTSDETRRRISAALTGRSYSEERKRNIGLAGKGRKLSDKTRRRMSEAVAASYRTTKASRCGPLMK
jgi:hypothetical protein